MHRLGLFSMFFAACSSGSSGSSSSPGSGSSTVTPPKVVPDASAPDATVRACNGQLRIAVGKLVAPASWCWRRIAEGDDLSGQLLDDRDRIRARYTLMAFDERVPNPCTEARAKPLSHQNVHGIALSVCITDRGSTCASLDGRVDLCTDSTIADGFDVATLGQMFER